MPKLYTVSVEVHKAIAKGYRVKILLPELGMYINGFMVFRPHDQFKEWSAVPPSQLAGRGVWRHIVEFDKKQLLWQEILDACIDAAKAEEQIIKDVVLEDISDEPIDLKDIPF
jgi:hypothetical protein